jgi:hypothetical protein
MYSRTKSTPRRRARIRTRRIVIASSAVIALTVSAMPAIAAPDQPDKPVSAWGKGGEKAEMPPVKVGTTKAPKTVREKVSEQLARWRAAQADLSPTDIALL